MKDFYEKTGFYNLINKVDDDRHNSKYVGYKATLNRARKDIMEENKDSLQTSEGASMDKEMIGQGATETQAQIHEIEQALEDLRAGKMILVTDDPNRENEGDLICAAAYATPENINFMATEAKGLICCPLSREWAEKLDLQQMCENNTDNHSTAFTVSIDHQDTSTGISAYERSYTIMKMVEPGVKPEDFRRPGHVFPLQARDGGIFVRSGHTEATVTFLRLAGLDEVGVCCEVMAPSGHMMRRDGLRYLAKTHNLTMTSIEALKTYLEHQPPVYQPHIMKRETEATFPCRYGENFKIYGYVNQKTGAQHVALTLGEWEPDEPVLVRIHSECLTGDALGSARCDCGDQYDLAMKAIAREGKGALIYLRQEGRGIGLINKLKAYHLQDEGMDTVEANMALGFPADARDYSEGAEILLDLGIHKLRLLTNNPDKVHKIRHFGLEVVERVSIEPDHKETNEFYLATKRRKMGHDLVKTTSDVHPPEMNTAKDEENL